MKIKKNFNFMMLMSALTAAFIAVVVPFAPYAVFAAENVTLDVINDEMFLPVGGVNPLIETPISEEEMIDVPMLATARIRSPLQRAGVIPQIPGGTMYGYNWISNPANTSASDSATLSAIYEALVIYADTTYNDKSTYSYNSSSNNYYAGTVNLSSAGLAINVVSGIYNQNGPASQKSLSLIRLAMAAFLRDNPQYYMIENGYSYSYNTGSALITSMMPHLSGEYKDYADRQRINTIIDTKYVEYSVLADTVGTDYEKARIVHDKILAERDYSYYSGTPDIGDSAHNILGVLDLSTRGPVCESYAEAYAYILNRLGIDTLTIFGQAGGGGSGSGGHAWNLVKIGGNYYYVDSTWNDFETVGNTVGTYNDEGNLKNALYYRYFMVGSSNSNFTTKHTAGTPEGDNGYYMFGMPSNISTVDYNTLTGSSYKWLMDNGYNNSSYTYGPNYDYYIGYTDKVGFPAEYPDALFVNGSGWSWNGWNSHDFGAYTVAATATDIPVEGTLWLWNFDRTESGFYNKFSNPVALTQNTNYEIFVEKPYHAGKNRAYIYGINEYRGIDFAIVDLTFDDASAEISDITVGGATESALPGNLTATIKLTNASVVRGGLANSNATSWFSNIPLGVTATANASSLSDTITLTFSGIPTTSSDATFDVSIPATAQTSGAAISVETNANAKYDISSDNAAAPTITVQPLDATVIVGTAYNLTVEATSPDGGALSYQWYSNAVNSTAGGMLISGATNATYTPPTTTSGTVYYYVVVTNTNNGVIGTKTATATSNIAAVKVNPHTYTVNINPTSYVFPPATTGYETQTETTFTITNTGTGQITGLTVSAIDAYFEIASPLSATTLNTGEQATVGVRPITGLAGSGVYGGSMNITADNGISELVYMSFSVNLPTPVITITNQPLVSTNVTAGNISGELSVAASVTGNETLSYQWYISTDGINTSGTVVNGASSANFTIPATLTEGTYYYFCEVGATGGAVSVRSDVATVIVAPAPVFSISLSGSGNYAFPAQTEGYSPIAPLDVTVTNTGNQPTGELEITLGGANGDSFTLSKTIINDIVAASSDLFSVVPNDGLATGTYTATVTVGGVNVTSRSFVISFTVNPAIVSISPISKTFPTATEGYGQQPEQAFVITNSTPQTISNLTASLDNGTDFEISTVLSSDTLDKNNFATVGVRPVTGLAADAAPYTGKLSIHWDSDNGTGLDAALSFTVADAPQVFVPVANIANVPSNAVAGKNLSLSATVVPSNATNQSIIWSVKSANGTGATITGSTFYASSKGTTLITATIINGESSSRNYTQDFYITVNSPSPEPATYYLTIYAESGGKIVQDVSGYYQHGDPISIAAGANSGYMFDRWISTDGGSFGNQYNASTVFYMPDCPTTVTARFNYQSSGSGASSGSSSSSQSQYTGAYISQSFVYLSKNNTSELSVRLYPGSYTFRSLRYGNLTLSRNTDYRVSGNDYTFTKSFLSGLYIGDNRIIFEMSGGGNPTLTVTITDTPSAAPAPIQTPVYIPPVTTQTTPSTATPAQAPMRTPAIDEKNTSYPVLAVEFNGKKINYSGQQAVVKNNKPLLPVRETFVALGYTVEWNQSSKTATIKRDRTVLTITNGDVYYTMHGFPYMFGDIPAQTLNGCLMMPSLDILDKLGYRAYRDVNNVVHIF